MMKQILKKSLFLTAILWCILLLMPAPNHYAYAQTNGQIQHVYDEAGLLSASELSELENLCNQYSEADQAEFIILTHNDANAVDGEIYIENFYDNKVYGDSIIILADMYNRDVVVEAYGSLQNKINGNRQNAIAEKVAPLLSREEYAQAFEKFIKSADKYINSVPIYLNSLLHLGAALIIGAISVVVMAYHSGGKMTVGSSTYIDQNHSGLIGRRDDYIRTQVTRIRKPQNNAGRGGGGGISAGGHSHSTGRAKF